MSSCPDCTRAPANASPAVDLDYVAVAVAECGGSQEALIPLLQRLQAHYGWLPRSALERLCALTGIAPAAVEGVATFYDQFRHLPAGRHLISVCHGTACHVRGAERIDDAIRRRLGLRPGEDTDRDRLFTVQRVACLGCCTLAPVVQAGGRTFGHLVPEGVEAMLTAIATGDSAVAADPAHPALPMAGSEIRIGVGSCCLAGGSATVAEAVRTELARRRLAVPVRAVGCVGICHQTPLVEVRLPGRDPVRYARVRPEQADGIVARHFAPGLRPIGALLGLVDHLLGAPSRVPAAGIDFAGQVFLAPQRRIATEGSGELGPLDLEAWRSIGGGAGLRAARALPPGQVVELIAAAGLRGRGGAGFPTGRKWAAVRAQPPGPRVVVCNGDEGDPGAFMDRMLLESFPFRVIEGLAIAAHAVGAEEGVFYIRAEYPLAVQRVRSALAALAGDALLAGLRLRVVEGAGAFVCGEETALLASVEGRRGMPRLRPPFPAESGLHGRPTCVNNVETLALIPWILCHGAAAFANVGSPGSKGTKVFALAGKVARGGLVEVPMGMSLRAIVEEVGGGVAGGKTFKAVQIGGPSGGCIPAALCDLPVDYEALGGVGAIMGSGGLVVLDQDDCMVDLARYFLRFTQDQSCGKCSFCRVGTRRLLDLLDRICEGRGKAADLDDLEALAQQVRAGSLCGLGQTAPNPVLTTLRYFRAEYESHLAGRCPAGRCKALIRYRITDRCTGCTRCAQACPTGAIACTPYRRHAVDDARCVRCDACRSACPERAVEVAS